LIAIVACLGMALWTITLSYLAAADQGAVAAAHRPAERESNSIRRQRARRSTLGTVLCGAGLLPVNALTNPPTSFGEQPLVHVLALLVTIVAILFVVNLVHGAVREGLI